MSDRAQGLPPPQLRQLLNGHDAEARDDAWRELVAEHSRLLIHVARSVAFEHDGAMDAYAFVLEQLRSDNYRPLRQYVDDGRSKFSTWLVVVARRMCLDFHRSRYGRLRASEGNRPSAEARREARRRLTDLAAAGMDVTSRLKSDDAGPDEEMRATELLSVLRSVLTDLDAADRLLLKLRFEDGLTARQIATVLECPTPFHVFRRLNALYERLRARLLAKGVESHVP